MEEGAVTGAEDETAVKSEAGAIIEPETVEGKAPDRDDADGGITVSPSSGSHSLPAAPMEDTASSRKVSATGSSGMPCRPSPEQVTTAIR